MTHAVEKEREDFEAWYIKRAKKVVPSFSRWSDVEVRDGCMRPDGESYKIDSVRIAWEAWQAARRAQAPQAQRAPLSDSLIIGLADDHMGLDSSYASLQKFARAIERAHGIGG